jgi:hypothetical protein
MLQAPRKIWTPAEADRSDNLLSFLLHLRQRLLIGMTRVAVKWQALLLTLLLVLKVVNVCCGNMKVYC